MAQIRITIYTRNEDEVRDVYKMLKPLVEAFDKEAEKWKKQQAQLKGLGSIGSTLPKLRNP